jgi:hypothetical protein
MKNAGRVATGVSPNSSDGDFAQRFVFVVVPADEPPLFPDATRPMPRPTKPMPAIQIHIGACIAACFTPAGLPGAKAAWSDPDDANAAVPLEINNADANATAPNFRNMKYPPVRLG